MRLKEVTELVVAVRVVWLFAAVGGTHTDFVKGRLVGCAVHPCVLRVESEIGPVCRRDCTTNHTGTH